MAFRKFAAANTRLAERLTEQVARLEAAQRELNQLETQVLKVAAELLEHAERRPSSRRLFVLDCVLAYLKLGYTLSETLNLMAGMAGAWARKRPRELLVPADLSLVEDLLAAVQSAIGSYVAVLRGLPASAFGRLLAQAIGCLRDTCTELQDAPLYNAGFLRTIFEAVTPLKKEDLDDFMLERFHGCLADCTAVPLEDCYAEAYASTCDAAHADQPLPGWAAALAHRCRRASTPTVPRRPSTPIVPREEDAAPDKGSPARVEVKHRPEVLEALLRPQSGEILPSPTVPPSARLLRQVLGSPTAVKRGRRSLVRLRQFNTWVVWMIGCALGLPALRVSALCARLVAADGPERRALIEEEVQAHLADPEFDAVGKAAQVRALIVRFCDIPGQLQAELQAAAPAPPSPAPT
eukprot:EG_transcript_9964